jgi:hypothetical protein
MVLLRHRVVSGRARRVRAAQRLVSLSVAYSCRVPDVKSPVQSCGNGMLALREPPPLLSATLATQFTTGL